MFPSNLTQNANRFYLTIHDFDKYNVYGWSKGYFFLSSSSESSSSSSQEPALPPPLSPLAPMHQSQSDLSPSSVTRPMLRVKQDLKIGATSSIEEKLVISDSNNTFMANGERLFKSSHHLLVQSIAGKSQSVEMTKRGQSLLRAEIPEDKMGIKDSLDGQSKAVLGLSTRAAVHTTTATTCIGHLVTPILKIGGYLNSAGIDAGLSYTKNWGDPGLGGMGTINIPGGYCYTPPTSMPSIVPTYSPTPYPTVVTGGTGTNTPTASRAPTYYPTTAPPSDAGKLVTAAPTFSSSCTTFWLGDGMCDSRNNNALCNYDNGDCCVLSCVTNRYVCGVSGYNCLDTRYISAAPSIAPTLGSSCTTAFLGDGWCDLNNNNALCNYDNGDCCASTCVNGPQYTCGISGNGYNCVDPRSVRPSVSPTALTVHPTYEPTGKPSISMHPTSTMAPSYSNTCLHSYGGLDCQYFISSWGVTCSAISYFYGYDCTGCRCPVEPSCVNPTSCTTSGKQHTGSMVFQEFSNLHCTGQATTMSAYTQFLGGCIQNDAYTGYVLSVNATSNTLLYDYYNSTKCVAHTFVGTGTYVTLQNCTAITWTGDSPMQSYWYSYSQGTAGKMTFFDSHKVSSDLFSDTNLYYSNVVFVHFSSIECIDYESSIRSSHDDWVTSTK